MEGEWCIFEMILGSEVRWNGVLIDRGAWRSECGIGSEGSSWAILRWGGVAIYVVTVFSTMHDVCMDCGSSLI